MIDSFSIEDAITIATNAHKGQLDKAGVPYIYHPLRVMNAVYGDHMKMAAVLHDVVEDTDVTLDSLRELGCPARVLGAIEVLTKRKFESHEAYITRVVESCNPIALAVKWADVMDNSGPERLSYMPQEDQARLSAKYLKAKRLLMKAM